jgi:hypothetical protein
MTIERSFLKASPPLPGSIPEQFQSRTNVIEIVQFGKGHRQKIRWLWPRTSKPNDIARALRQQLLREGKPSEELVQDFVDTVSAGGMTIGEVAESQLNLISYLGDLPTRSSKLLSKCQATLPGAQILHYEIYHTSAEFERLGLVRAISQTSVRLANEPFMLSDSYKICRAILDDLTIQFHRNPDATWDNIGLRSLLSRIMPGLAMISALERACVVLFLAHVNATKPEHQTLDEYLGSECFFRSAAHSASMHLLRAGNTILVNGLPSFDQILEVEKSNPLSMQETLVIRSSLWAILAYYSQEPDRVISDSTSLEITRALGVGAPITFVPAVSLVRMFPSAYRSLFGSIGDPPSSPSEGVAHDKPPYWLTEFDASFDLDQEPISSNYLYVIALLVANLAKGDSFVFETLYRAARMRKRHVALSVLSGLRCSKWMCKFLHRCDGELLLQPEWLLERLVRLDRSPKNKKAVSKLDNVSYQFFRWLLSLREDEFHYDFVIAMQKFNSKITNEKFEWFLDIFRDSSTSSKKLRARLAKCRTADQISSISEKIFSEPFPDPPFFDRILWRFDPLDSQEKLRRFERKTKSLVGHMGHAICQSWEDKRYVYSYRNGQLEATVEVICKEAIGWQVDLAYGNGNGPLTTDQRKMIEDDLADVLRDWW